MNQWLLATHHIPDHGLGKINIPKRKVDIVTVTALPSLLLTLMLVICLGPKFVSPIVFTVKFLGPETWATSYLYFSPLLLGLPIKKVK